MSEAPVEAFGPYLVYEQLGAGGMARVNRAELSGIEGFHRPVALKRMLPHCASNDEMVKAFVREARLASHLRHANVAQTYELGKVDDTYFIAMELITGRTLRAVLKHCAQTTGPMPVPISLNILNQICDALDYAHNLCDETGQPLGIIHRDVSPSNIIVDDAGVVKLIDFGIAKASAAGMQTMSGTIKGKFGYMAPEYIFGRIDARVDLFALGVIAHELLTNRPLFSVADDMETLQRVRAMPLSPPSRRNPNVPAEIDDIVMTALARDPDRRWQHATALRNALTTVTKRLGLVCTNANVVEWIAFAFDQTRPQGMRAAPEELEPGVSDASISIAEPPTRAEPRSHRASAVSHSPAPASPSPASSQMITLMRDGRPPAPPDTTPAGTPGYSISAISAQRSAQVEPSALGEEYRAAVAAYQRHEAQPPSGASTDAVKTAMLRPSGRVDAPAPAGARTSGLRDGVPGGAPVPPTAPPAPAPPNVRARDSQAPPISNRTLLDGAAALRSRSASQAAALATGSPPIPASSPPIPASSPPPVSASMMAVAPPPGEAPLPEPEPERRSSAAMVVVLVLLAAGLAAAGVYFVLPYLT